MITQFCFTVEVRGPARHLSGNENYSLGKGGESVLTSRDVSSLVEVVPSSQRTKHSRCMLLL